MNEKLEATPCRIAVLAVLRNGPSTWRDVRVAYYGPVRSQSKSNTSFQNQLGRMIEKVFFFKQNTAYEITALGREMIGSLNEEAIAAAKSKAHTMAEVK
jgi:hypothetical protein